MKSQDAEALLAGAVPRRPGVWADFGAGGGMFSRALARLLGAGSRIYAVDRDLEALATLHQGAETNGVELIPVRADFTHSPALPTTRLDGMLFANALHFVPDPAKVIAGLAEWLRPGGRLVIVEYDGRRANRWVPHPIPAVELPNVLAGAGFSPPTITATRPSAFGGTIYVAAADRLIPD